MSENGIGPSPMHRIRNLRDLSELASDAAPSRDLWPAIRAQIDAGAALRRSGARRYAIGVAAAIALVAIGAWLGRSTLPGIGVNPGGVEGSGSVRADGSIAGRAAAARRAAAPDTIVQPVAFIADPRYRAQRAELLAQVDAKIAALPPESQAKVRESLVTLQRAVADLEAALGREPSDALLQELLVNARQDEMRVLTTIAEAGTAGRET